LSKFHTHKNCGCKLDLYKITPDKYALWDDFVLNHKDGTFFHTVKWMKILNNCGFGEPIYMILGESNEIYGILPLFNVNIFPMGKALISSLDYNGPLLKNVCNNSNYFNLLFKHIECTASEYNVSYINIRVDKFSYINSIMPPKYIPRSEYCTLNLDLREGTEKIFQKYIHKKTRTAIRKATKLGKKVNLELADVQTYWQMHKNVMVRNRDILDEKKLIYSIKFGAI